MNPRVKDVVARDDHRLEITFTNGEVGIFDCSHLLSFGVFQELRDLWPNRQPVVVMMGGEETTGCRGANEGR